MSSGFKRGAVILLLASVSCIEAFAQPQAVDPNRPPDPSANAPAIEREMRREEQDIYDRNNEARKAEASREASEQAIAAARAKAYADAPARARQKAREAWVKQLVRAGLYAGMADSEIGAITAARNAARATSNPPDRMLLCRNARSAKPYYAEARPLATEVLKLIGRDMFGDFKADKAKMTGLIQTDDDLSNLLRDCPSQPAAAAVVAGPDSGGRCHVTVRNGVGQAEAQTRTDAGRGAETLLAFRFTPRSAPGTGPLKAAPVLVGFDMNIVVGATANFDGLDAHLTFPSGTPSGPIDLTVTMGDVTFTGLGLTADASNRYAARLRGPPSTDDDALEAYGKADLIHVRVTSAGSRDRELLDADVPIGTRAERDALTQNLSDALNKQKAAGC